VPVLQQSELGAELMGWHALMCDSSHPVGITQDSHNMMSSSSFVACFQVVRSDVGADDGYCLSNAARESTHLKYRLGRLLFEPLLHKEVMFEVCIFLTSLIISQLFINVCAATISFRGVPWCYLRSVSL
jgi:hypothetical protein